MTRKQFLLTSLAAAARPLWAMPRCEMGVATTCYMTVWRPSDTYEFLEHCQALGAGGIQAFLSSTDAGYVKKLRARAEQAGMYLEFMIAMPKEDTSAFEATVKAAKEAGGLCVRANCMPGRRYENIDTLEEWRRLNVEARKAIDRALPIVEKHGIPLALENHKDWTASEMAALMKEKSSEHLGVCLDTGNNISLLDDPMDVVEKLAPYAVCAHVKDMGIARYKDGFLLSEMPLGEGFLDMKQVVSTIHHARPKTKITLEMITRNPLEVPCLTDKYWVTFPERNGRYLARTLRMVDANARRDPLPKLDSLDKPAQMRLEEDNVKQCLFYAREQLGL
jgi:sugar phosphate isomerase/epimerase